VRKPAIPPGWHAEGWSVAARPTSEQYRAMHRDVVGANRARNWVVEGYRRDQQQRWQAALFLGCYRLLHGPSSLEKMAHEALALVSILASWSGATLPPDAKRTLLRRVSDAQVNRLAYGDEACAVAEVCSLFRLWAGHARWKVHPGLPTSFEELRWLWNRQKDSALPWWRACSKEALSSGIEKGSLAMRNHRESLVGLRAGQRVGLPRFSSVLDGGSYAITTGTSDLVDARHVRLAKVPGKVELGEDCSGLYARITEGSIQLKRISVTEHPDGSLRVSFGLYVRDEPVPVPTYVPRGLDMGCSTALMPSSGKPLELARRPSRPGTKATFVNASGVAKALSVSVHTTMVARLLSRCGNGHSLARIAVDRAKDWCKECDPEHSYRALKLLLADDAALDEIAALDGRIREQASHRRKARRDRHFERVHQRDIERDEIHRLGHSPTSKGRLALKRERERERRRRRRARAKEQARRLGRSPYARGDSLWSGQGFQVLYPRLDSQAHGGTSCPQQLWVSPAFTWLVRKM